MYFETFLNVKKTQYVLQHWGIRRFIFSQVSFTEHKKKLLTPYLFHALSSESNVVEAFLPQICTSARCTASFGSSWGDGVSDVPN